MPDQPIVYDAILVGAGLAGLTCAKHLAAAGKQVLLLEASGAVGGRVRTDSVEGFRLDRGFQVYNPAYPDASAELDHARLDLRPYEPGALIRYGGKFHRLSDPWRRPAKALATATSGVATLRDKFLIARLRSKLRSDRSLDAIVGEEVTTLEALQRFGFSELIIERFFRPFLGGVFLEQELATSSRMFEYVFRLFGEGDVSLPAAGMQAIPEQLAAALPPGVLELNAPVESLTETAGTPDGGVLVKGQRRQAKHLVLATEGPVADRLLGEPAPERRGRATTCVYFATDRAPLSEPILLLSGEGPAAGPINNLSLPSQVAPGYAPAGRTLVSVTVLGDPAESDDDLVESICHQAFEWFGPQVRDWSLLRVCRVRYALPDQTPPRYQAIEKSLRARQRVFVCGDRYDMASINGAMRSGRRTAEALLQELSG